MVRALARRAGGDRRSQLSWSSGGLKSERQSIARCAPARCTGSTPASTPSIAPELLSDDALLLSALFAAGPDAFLSHGTAAWRWQITPAPPIAIEVALPRRRQR